jgi:hypothetical protein
MEPGIWVESHPKVIIANKCRPLVCFLKVPVHTNL